MTGVSSDAIKSVVALFVVLLTTTAMLIKFDKMPGIHLSPGGGLKFSFDAASSEAGAGAGGDGSSAKADELRLGGLSGPPWRRLAIINNLTFSEGEMVLIWCGATNVNVRCVEIRANSVIAQREDVAALIELFLGDTRPKLHALASETNAISQTNLQAQAVLPDRTASIEMTDSPAVPAEK